MNRFCLLLTGNFRLCIHIQGDLAISGLPVTMLKARKDFIYKILKRLLFPKRLSEQPVTSSLGGWGYCEGRAGEMLLISQIYDSQNT